MLYLVSTPIGNIDDLTFRAKQVLGSVDCIICESTKETSKMLRKLGMSGYTLEVLSEHTREADILFLVDKIQQNQDTALVSDCGTPVFADPGLALVRKCIDKKIPITPVSGVASPIAGLVVSGFPIHRWYYRGFLSPKKDMRRRELEEIRREKLTTIIMETPYRLHQLLRDMHNVLGSEREIALCRN